MGEKPCGSYFLENIFTLLLHICRRVSTKTIIWQVSKPVAEFDVILLWVTTQMAVRLVSSQVIGKPRLYSYQKSLPSLPVPRLQDTCRRVR